MTAGEVALRPQDVSRWLRLGSVAGMKGPSARGEHDRVYACGRYEVEIDVVSRWEHLSNPDALVLSNIQHEQRLGLMLRILGARGCTVRAIEHRRGTIPDPDAIVDVLIVRRAS